MYLDQHGFRKWVVACSAPSHDLNQCFLSTGPSGTYFNDALFEITNFQFVIYKMSAILFVPDLAVLGTLLLTWMNFNPNMDKKIEIPVKYGLKWLVNSQTSDQTMHKILAHLLCRLHIQSQNSNKHYYTIIWEQDELETDWVQSLITFLYHRIKVNNLGNHAHTKSHTALTRRFYVSLNKLLNKVSSWRCFQMI